MAKLWIARWRNNSLHLYNHKPHRVNDLFWANDGTFEYNFMPLDADMFPEVTYENSPVEVSLQKAPSLEEALKELESMAQEALQNIEKASTDYADSKLPESPYSKHTMRKQTLYDWSDIAEAFEAGVRWMANKNNITF